MIGNNLKNIRKTRGFSQEYVASKLNISRQTLSNWENDKSRPDIECLKLLSELYGVSLDKIVGNPQPETENSSMYYQNFFVLIALLSLLLMSTYISLIGLIVSAVVFFKTLGKNYPVLLHLTCIVCFFINAYNFAIFLFNTFFNWGIVSIS